MVFKFRLETNLMILLFFLSSFSATAQWYATTDDGDRVVLKRDGTWELLNSDKTSNSYIYLGQEKLLSGEKELVFESQFSTKMFIQLAKKEKQMMIIFWEESDFVFQEGLWTNSALLFLEDGSTIKLVDRNAKGTNIIQDGMEKEETYALGQTFKTKSDLYQRYILFYLSIADCEKLRKSEISSVSYNETSQFEAGRKIVNFNNNQSTCEKQLNALND